MRISTLRPRALTSYSNAASPAAGPAAPESRAPRETVTLGNTNGAARPESAPSANTNGKAPAKDWTVMVWLCSDNNLYSYQMNNLADAERTGSTPQMNVVAELSRVPDGGGVQRVEVDKGKAPVKQELGKDVNMGSPKALADFIKWTKAHYPAKHYMLILNDHGNGWQGCCEDESHDGWLTLPKLEQGLKDGRQGSDGKPLDVVGFDACLMANVETADQLKDEARYLVGSEETEGGAGWQYNTILNHNMLDAAQTRLVTRAGLSPGQMARVAVDMAHRDQGDLPTMAAIKTSEVPALVHDMSRFRQAIVNTSVPSSQLGQVANNTQSFTMEKDLYDFADRVSHRFSSSDGNLGQAADAVKADLGKVVVDEQHSSSYPNAHGMTVELNKSFDSYGFQVNPHLHFPHIQFDTYQHTKFDQDTHWDQAVAKINGGQNVHQAADSTPAKA